MGTWVPGYLDTWVPGYLDARIPGHPGTLVPDILPLCQYQADYAVRSAAPPHAAGEEEWTWQKTQIKIAFFYFLFFFLCI